MKITRVRVFQLEGEARAGLALYEIPRGGLAANEVTPHRYTFTQVETDEGLTGLSYGGSAEIKALGELLVGEDPIRVEYLWEKLYQSAYHRLRIANLAVLDLCLWDVIGKAKGEPVHRLLGLHLLFANPERTCPLGEWGVKINHNAQHFYRDFYAPKDGYFEPPTGPGFGYELDEAKIRARVELP